MQQKLWAHGFAALLLGLGTLSCEENARSTVQAYATTPPAALCQEGERDSWVCDGGSQLLRCERGRWVPEGECQQPTWVYITTGFAHSCGLRFGGEVACWGRADEGQLQAPFERFVALSAARAQTCGLRIDGRAACWGQYALETGEHVALVPVPSERFVQIGAGDDFACGITFARDIVCWGEGNAAAARKPGNFRALSAGARHACALDETGSALCWGDNVYGETQPPPGMFESIDAATTRTCGISTAEIVECWGYKPEEAKPPQPQEILALQTGGIEPETPFLCTREQGGQLRAWGNREVSQFEVPPGRFHQLSCGETHCCALRTDGEILCWGLDHQGQTSVP